MINEQRHFSEKIEQLIAEPLAAIGYEVFHIEMLQTQGRILQVMIERIEGESVDIDDCVAASRAISLILDEDEDIVPGKYTLEVSSPGIDRPLIRQKDFERYQGEVIQVDVVRLINGQKKFLGALVEVSATGIKMDVRGETMEIPFDDIKRAKLSLKEQLKPKGQKKGQKKRN